MRFKKNKDKEIYQFVKFFGNCTGNPCFYIAFIICFAYVRKNTLKYLETKCIKYHIIGGKKLTWAETYTKASRELLFWFVFLEGGR